MSLVEKLNLGLVLNFSCSGLDQGFMADIAAPSSFCVLPVYSSQGQVTLAAQLPGLNSRPFELLKKGPV